MNCKNCFKKGHCIDDCTKTINSYGIILYTTIHINKEIGTIPTPTPIPTPIPNIKSNPEITTVLSSLPQNTESIGTSSVHNKISIPQKLYKYLMIKRKHSLGYVSIVCGKYCSNTSSQLQSFVDKMTNYEKDLILNNTFEENWNYLWGGEYRQSNSKKQHSKEKYELNIDNIAVLIHISETSWKEPEWEFPKGRKNYVETEIDCAIREFEEETGISQHNISIITNLQPFQEIYTSFNNKRYNNTYFIAKLNVDDSEIELLNFQAEEVSQLEWKTMGECLDHIRYYNTEKKELIMKVNQMLQEHAVM